MSTAMKHCAAVLLYTFFQSASASPIPSTISKRALTGGAKAGLGIAIAIIVIGLIVGAVFFVLSRRRKAHNDSINRERAILAGEKNADGSDKVDKFAPEPEISAMPRRNKSVKDRLMGPLYRGSMIEMPPVPSRARVNGGGSNRQSTMTLGDGEFLNKPWTAQENSPRPSFSSKRATRMMMMM